MPRGRMGGRHGMSTEKAKDFKGTMKKLMGYLTQYKIGLLLVVIFAIGSTIFNIAGPKILGNTTGVSSFWVLFSILLFGGLWGIVGMVIAVPLFGVIYDIIRKLTNRVLQKNHQGEMREAYDNYFHKPEQPKEKPSESKLSREKLLEAKVKLQKKWKQHSDR